MREITAKSLLRKQKKIDSWFISRYGMNLYRGCAHNCAYCDGRAEGYYVEGDFGDDVAIKVNAAEVLRRELHPGRKRTPLPRSFLVVGGGVGDSYQPAEQTYQLTRSVLHVIHHHHFPVHMLTKSTLIERDIDLLTAINAESRALISMSFSSVDDAVSAIVEPGVPAPSERLKTLARFKQNGFACGMFLMPVMPFLTDSPAFIDRAFRAAAKRDLDYLLFSGMTLKDGRQKDYFLNVLHTHYPALTATYRRLYPGDKWGAATSEYYQALHQTFGDIARQYPIPIRIPARLYQDILSEKELVVVILEQLDYLLNQQGHSSPYGYAAYAVSQLKEPLPRMKGTLQTVKGIGKVTENIILEILETGTSSYYETLLNG